MIHLPHCTEPAGRLAQHQGTRSLGRVPTLLPSLCGSGINPSPYGDWLDFKAWVCPSGWEAQLPPREQRPPPLSENRLGVGVRAVGTRGLTHALDPHLPIVKWHTPGMATASSCATPSPTLSNNPTEKMERAPELLHLPETNRSRGQCIREATM